MPVFANNNVVQFCDGYLTEFSTRVPGKSTSTTDRVQQNHRLALLRSMALPSSSTTTQVQQLSAPDSLETVRSEAVAFDPNTVIKSRNAPGIIADLEDYPTAQAFYRVFGSDSSVNDSDDAAVAADTENDIGNYWRDTVANYFVGALIQNEVMVHDLKNMDKRKFRDTMITVMTAFWSDSIMSDGPEQTPITVQAYLEKFKTEHPNSVNQIERWQHDFVSLQKKVRTVDVQGDDVVMLAWVVKMWMHTAVNSTSLTMISNVEAVFEKVWKEGKTWYNFAMHSAAALIKLTLERMQEVSHTVKGIPMAGKNMIQRFFARHFVAAVEGDIKPVAAKAAIAAPDTFLARSQIDEIKSSTHWAAPRMSESTKATASAVCDLNAVPCRPQLQRTRMPASHLMHLYDRLAMRLQ